MLIQLPDLVIDKLSDLLEAEDANKWEVGWFIVDVVDEFYHYYRDDQEAREKARTQVVREMAKKCRRSEGGLRDREVMGRFFTRKDVADYHMLTYHQMRACKYAGPEDWRKWADWAASNFASVEAIRDAIAQQKGVDPIWKRQLDRLLTAADKLLTLDDTPSGVREVIQTFKERLSETTLEQI